MERDQYAAINGNPSMKEVYFTPRKVPGGKNDEKRQIDFFVNCSVNDQRKNNAN